MSFLIESKNNFVTQPDTNVPFIKEASSYSANSQGLLTVTLGGKPEVTGTSSPSLEEVSQKTTKKVQELFEVSRASGSPSAEFIASQLLPDVTEWELLIEEDNWDDLTKYIEDSEIDDKVLSQIWYKLNDASKFYHELYQSEDISDNTNIRAELKKISQAIKTLKRKRKQVRKKAYHSRIPRVKAQDNKIQEVALSKFKEVHFSHATIADKLSGGNITLDKLETSLRSKGWDRGKGHIRLFSMPDNSLTSYDNRRLYVLKKIAHSENPPEMTVPSTIRNYSDRHGKLNDIDHHISELRKDIFKESTNNIKADTQVTDYRNYLLGDKNSLPFQPTILPNSEGHYLLLRVYRDAGKHGALEKGHKGSVDDFNIVYGYKDVYIRKDRPSNLV